MNTFGNLFNDVLKFRNKWDYYGDTQFNFKNYKEFLYMSKYFIESYIANGDKLDESTRKQFNLIDDGLRLEHTVSLYFLGIIIYENVKLIRDSIDNFIYEVDERMINSRKNHLDYTPNVDTPFSYFWFLICFFHDYGYSFETEDKNDALVRLFEHLEGNINFCLPKGFLMKTWVPKVISESIKKYAFYKYKCHNQLDHGIVGGLLFWEQTSKDYFQKRILHDNDDFKQNNRFWSREILNYIHLPVSWTIAAHNVWFIDSNHDNFVDYQNYGLDRLIVSKPKVFLNRHPLLYLLSIVDTIDPVKLILKNKCNDYKIDNLDFVEYKFWSNRILFQFKSSQKIETEDFKKNFIKIEQWLQCKSWYEDEIYNLEF